MNEKITDKHIRIAVRQFFKRQYVDNRAGKSKWEIFEEFRPFTGFAGNVNQIDMVVVGVYEKNKKIIALEIKISRQDFLKDVCSFYEKHKYALELSNEFYYVCPWGLIDPGEIPDEAGLYYLNKGNKLTKKKQSKPRKMDCIDMEYFQSFAQYFGSTINPSLVPVEYLGKEITQKEFMELVAKKADEMRTYEDRRKIEEEIKNGLGELPELERRYKELLNAGGEYFPPSITDEERKVRHDSAAQSIRNSKYVQTRIGEIIKDLNFLSRKIITAIQLCENLKRGNEGQRESSNRATVGIRAEEKE